MVGVMELIRELSKLPIECAVPVSRDTVRIQMVTGFPPSVQVEIHIREGETLKKLTRLELQIGKTEPLNPASQAHSRRRVHEQPPTREAGRALRAIRLHTDNCDAKGVTASASETLSALTLGLATPGVRYYQSVQFEAASVWTAPEHYKAEEFARTYGVCGYYDRVKFLLTFNDDALLDAWRLQIEQLLTQAQLVAGPPSMRTALLGLFS